MELVSSMMWWNRPDWIGVEESCLDSLSMPEECIQEPRVRDREGIHELLVNSKKRRVISIERFSSLERLLCVTAYVLKFAKHLKGVECESRVIVPEIARVEVMWILRVQETGQAMKKWTEQYGAFKDEEGLWRCGGRNSNAEVPFDVEHPILLTRQHTFTRLVVKRAHKRLAHSGVKETLTELCSKILGSKGESLSQTVHSLMSLVQKIRALPYRAPLPHPLSQTSK